MARPKKENKALKVLGLRVTQEEHQTILKSAMKAGLTITNWFRRCLGLPLSKYEKDKQ
jgi:hypothetical protein